MDNDNSVIYGLEFQSRALAPILAETEKIKFVTGTQSLKQNNQIHLVEFNEENSSIKASVFQHSSGEIWKITSSPIDATKLAVCYNSVIDEVSCSMKTCILRLPVSYDPNIVENLEVINKLDIENCNKIKTTEFHPLSDDRTATVTEYKIILWDTSQVNCTPLLQIPLEGKNNPKFTTGKFNPHQNCNQFTAATETSLKTYDIRSRELAWSIESAHKILLRDMDYNMNKQYHIATCGDDSFVKIWDYRQTSQPVYSRNDHTHWICSVKFNPFHDQLILTASTDGRVLLSSATSVSSENVMESSVIEDQPESKQILCDGPLQWCEHEDSVYCAEWSPAEPWVFASLSHDGRLLISKVKRSLKYQIML